MGGDPRLAAGHLGASPHSPARNCVTPDCRGPRTPTSWLVWLGVCSWGPLALWSACAPAFAQQPMRLGRVQLPRGTQRWWPSSETRGWTPPGNVQTTSADPRGRCCGHGSQQRGIAVGTSTITAKVYSASAGGGRCSRAFCVPSPVLLVTACPVVVLLSSCCAEETEAQRCFRHSSQSHIWRTAEPGFQPR